MRKYFMKRLAITIPTFLGITVLVFFLSSLAPGSPLEILLNNPNASPDLMARMEERLGLDQPVYIQYLRWLGQLLQGNLGFSYRTGHPVWIDIMERVGPTLILTLSSLVFSIIIALPLGIMAAYKPYSLWDYISSGISFIGASIPNFFTGLMLVYFLSVKIKLFPSGGMYDTSGVKSLEMMIYHMILPMLVLSLQQVGGLIRQTRGSILEVLQDDYVRTARAKGCSEFRVLIAHVLRTGMGPVVTRIGGMLPFLVGGAVVTEQIFSWPGLGSLMVLAINSRDYPVIMGITVIIAVAVLVGNVLIDFIYSLLDPRIRYN